MQGSGHLEMEVDSEVKEGDNAEVNIVKRNLIQVSSDSYSLTGKRVLHQ